VRVLFVSLIEDYWGGSEILWSKTAHALRPHHTVGAYFAYCKNNPPIQALKEDGVSLFYGTPIPTIWWKRIGRTGRRGLDAFRQTLAQFAPQLVVFSQGALKEGTAEMAACREAKVNYAIINQLVEPLYYDDRIWKSIRESITRAKRIWFVSKENRSAVEAWLGSDLVNAVVINNATGEIATPLPPWPDESCTWRLACVGRLYPKQKGQDLLIDVLGSEKWRDRPLEVTLYGAGERENLEARIRYKQSRNIKFGGFVSALGDIWARHHALIMPSRYEGQSLAMLEAMLHERPVFVTPVGGTRGLVVDGVNGLVASHIDREGINDLLERAWERRSEWRAFGQSARRLAAACIDTNPGAAMAARIETMMAKT